MEKLFRTVGFLCGIISVFLFIIFILEILNNLKDNAIITGIVLICNMIVFFNTYRNAEKEL